MPPFARRSATSEDRQLVDRIRAGDASAFETLFRDHFAVLFRFASSFVPDGDGAEDVVQEVLGWVWVHRAEWAPPSDVLSYLLAAVRNRALDLVRTERRRSGIARRDVAPGESPAMAAPGAAADASLEASERSSTVWRFVHELPEQRRSVLLLRWRHGLEWEEVARVMGTSVPAARMHHSRALKTLRERLPGALE